MSIDMNLTGLDALSSAADCLKTLAHPHYRVEEEGIRDIMHCVESRFGCAKKEDS